MSRPTDPPRVLHPDHVATAARRALVVVLALVAALVVFPAPNAASEAAPAPEEKVATVNIAAAQMMPQRLEITTGTTVSWVNLEPFDYPAVGGTHSLIGDDGAFESPPIAPGTRWAHRFKLPGTFGYHCRFHTVATGEIVVTGDPVPETPSEKEVTITETDPDDPTVWAFQPADLVIETGTTVIWRNNGKNVHTVTADDESFNSGDVAPGGTWRKTFDAPGVFSYHCTPHPWMTALVRVVVPGGTVPDAPPPRQHDAGGMVTADDGPAPARAGPGPARLDVRIVEADAANPNSWRFSPATVDVMTGDTVVWTNLGAAIHTVTSDTDAFGSPELRPGETYGQTFDTPGVFSYRCTPHPWMRGRVRVTEPGQEPPALADAVDPGPRSSAAAAPMPVRRTGSGPVTVPVNIVEPSVSEAMSWTFAPKVVDIKAGDSVVWRNLGTLQHTVTADAGDFDTGLLSTGTTFQRRFDTVGAYSYRCTPHPWMKGVVRVAAAEGGEPPPLPELGSPLAPGEQAAALPPGRSGSDASAAAGRVYEAADLGSNRTFFLALLLAALILAATWFLASLSCRRDGATPAG